MSSEKALWQTFRRRMGSSYGLFKRIENMVDPGMPDVVFVIGGVTGFMELKEIDKFPARTTTKIDIGFTTAQPEWHREWARYGGRSVVLLQVSSPKVYYFIRGKNVEAASDGWTREQLDSYAIGFRSSLDPGFVIKSLTGFTL